MTPHRWQQWLFYAGLLAALLFGLNGTARAAFSPQELWRVASYQSCSTGHDNTPVSSAMAALSGYGAAFNANCNNGTVSGYSIGPYNASPTFQSGYALHNGAGPYLFAVLEPVASCPADSSLVNGQCVCTSGYTEATSGGVTSCTPPGPPPSNCAADGDVQNANTTTRYSIPGSGSTACMGGCVVVPEFSYGTGTNRWGTGPWYSMGLTCSSGTTATPDATPQTQQQNACPVNQCPVQINGTVACAVCGTTTNDVTPPPPGASSPGTTSTTVNPDGTVTTTTRSGDGTTTSTTNPGQQIGLEGYCLRNPTAFICTGTPGGAPAPGPSASAPETAASASSFGGACSGGFTCSGDAVQCAIAREQHRRMCELVDANPSQVQAIAAAMAATPGPVSGFTGSPASPIEVNIGTMMSGAPGSTLGTSCPGDYQVGPILIPLASACPAIQLMGQIAVAMTVLSLAVWLGRGAM